MLLQKCLKINGVVKVVFVPLEAQMVVHQAISPPPVNLNSINIQKESALTFMKQVNVLEEKVVNSPINVSTKGVEGSMLNLNVLKQDTKCKNFSPKVISVQAVEKLPQIPTPVKYQILEKLMVGYDPLITKYLVDGFHYGFSIDNDQYVSNLNVKNLKTSFQNPDFVDTYLDKEIAAGRISVPCDHVPLDNMVFSPVGVHPKKQPGKFRIIQHLSFPKGSSINDGISRDNARVKYASVPDAISKIRKIGKNSFLAKTDIKSAFRIVPVHPNDYHLLGIKWKGKYMYDKVLVMGCSSSCKNFETFATALEWIISQKISDTEVLHILDDFLFIAKKNCNESLTIFLNLCEHVGVPIAPDKTMGPLVALPFAGIDLNTVEMAAYLPQDKIEKFVGMLDKFLGRSSVTLKEMQSITGMLNFACGIVAPGRAFSRRLYDLTIGVKKSYYKIKLTQDVKLDLETWKWFLMQSNRKYFFLDYIWLTDEVLQLHTDASTSIGYGAYYGTHWISGEWDDTVLNQYHITLLEFYPIFVSIYLWGNYLSNKCILLNCDNMAMVYILNKNTSKDKNIMTLLRKFVIICMKYNIFIRAKHIPGKLNVIADFLSRSQVSEAKQINHFLEAQKTQVPESLHLKRLLDISINYWDQC
jgi:hypothetical protein